MDYLKIRNWDRWQTYRKDRGQPPWIKVHRCVMRNCEWVSLTDAERGQLVAMWLLSADHDGAIPASPEMIQKLCFMSKPPNLSKFTELGFIEDGWRQDGVTLASNGCQHDQPKAEESREEKNSSDFSEKFLFIWKSYPGTKKGGKQQAWKAWQKAKNIPDDLFEIFNKQQKQKKSLRDKKEFCPEWPHFSTYINQARWDEIFEISQEIDKGQPGIDFCKECGTTKFGHLEKGMCNKCREKISK